MNVQWAIKINWASVSVLMSRSAICMFARLAENNLEVLTWSEIPLLSRKTGAFVAFVALFLPYWRDAQFIHLNPTINLYNIGCSCRWKKLPGFSDVSAVPGEVNNCLL